MATMNKVAIVTDSNSGISQAKAEKYGVFVLPMSFNIDGEQYYEGVSINHNEFFEAQRAGKKIFTSQPSPAEVMNLWDKVLKDYESIVYMPMAGGLSSSLSTAMMLADEYEDKVQVVDNQRITVSLKQAVLDAKKMADAGKTASYIKTQLNIDGSNASIYMMVDDMKYLKAGGRVSGAAAAMATVLNIKPVLGVNNGIIGAYGKARGVKAAKKMIFEALEKDMDSKYHSMNIDDYYLYTAAALNREEAIAWNEEVEDYFAAKSQIEVIPMSICAHVGVGTFGACICKKISDEI